MKAITRLVWSYFMSTPLTRAFSIGGLILCASSLYVLTTFSQSQHMLVFAEAGQFAFFLGSSMMPLTAGRLSQSLSGRLLPFGRVKILVSMMLTVAIVALPAGLLTPFVAVAGVGGKLTDLASHPKMLEYTIDLALIVYTSFCMLAAWLYLAMWFVTSQRNSTGFAKGMLVIVILLIAPSRQLDELNAKLQDNLLQLAIGCSVFAVVFLNWPRLKQRFAQLRIPGLSAAASSASSQTSGKEIDLILGTHNPWLFIALQVIPIFAAIRISESSLATWLYVLAIFSAVTGAVSSQASERSRALWLRGGWSREELFVQVERSFARHNCFVLGVLLALTVGIGSYAGFPTELLAFGLVLLILGTVVSTYLGLVVTRGLRWAESTIGVAIMMLLMSVALLLDTETPRVAGVLALEGLLAVSAIVLRIVARRRWANIDWTQCRPLRAVAARGA